MWRGRVHGAWFAGAVTIAVIGVVALSVGSDGAGSHDAGSWVIAVVTFVGVAYCLFRASRRNPGPPAER
jgi:hypothetical protein